jgi:hypothetical protein
MSSSTNNVMLYLEIFAILVALTSSFLPVDIEDIVETLPVPEKYYLIIDLHVVRATFLYIDTL